MGQSTEELNQDIARTRESLGRDLDDLQDRVSPSAIVERRKAAVRGRVSTVRDKVMGTAHDVHGSVAGSASSAGDSVSGTAGHAADSARHAAASGRDSVQGSPLAAGLVAFGAGAVIAALMPPTEAEAKAASQLADQAQPVLDEAKSVGQDVGQQLGEKASEAAQEVKDTAADSAQRVQGEATSSAQDVKEQAPGG